MQTPLSVEELIVDDSFIHYCYGRAPQHIQYWENYLLIFPDQNSNIEEARNIVLGLSQMFTAKEQAVALEELKQTVETKQRNADMLMVAPVDETATPARSSSSKRIWAYAAAAAVIGFGIFLSAKLLGPVQPVKEQVAQSTVKHTSPLVYTTSFGEKKTVWLADSTKVILNARSTLKTNADYGVNSREVYLTGEALFDVTHNAQKPFVVNMNQFEVKVLGTLFNVKAYPEDKIQETSLIRGKVQVIFKNGDNNSIYLNPNEKAIIPNKDDGGGIIKIKDGRDQPLLLAPTIAALTINSKDSTIAETSWVYDRLDIYDKTFSQIRPDLERLYNVNIDFEDKKVANYRFSATFEKETIEQVLQALQLSYPFHYTIENSNITISK